MKPTPLSKMRDQVVIQSPNRAQDSYGQAVITSWTDVATVWARVEPLSGREPVSAGGVRPDVTHRVTIRYYDGLLPSWRLKLGTRYLHVEGVVDVEDRGREHDLACKEAL